MGRFPILAAVLLALSNSGAIARMDGDPVCEIARQSGTPQVPGLTIVYLFPLGSPAEAPPWRNIILHQMEGPPGAARQAARAQSQNPYRRGTTLWVETDGTVYWAVPEDAVPLHGDGGNRRDNKYVDNADTFRKVTGNNSLGIEFAGNFPDVRKPATQAQRDALIRLLPFLQERYRIPSERVYAHNWIDHKDARYCEGCELGELARRLAYQPRC